MPDVPDSARKPQPPEVKAMLFGLGFDSTDGHTHITRGDEFTRIGGSNDTHEHIWKRRA